MFKLKKLFFMDDHFALPFLVLAIDFAYTIRGETSFAITFRRKISERHGIPAID